MFILIFGNFAQIEFRFSFFFSPRQHVADCPADAGSRDTVLFVVDNLNLPSAIGHINRPLHTAGNMVGVHNNPTFDVPGGPANSLNQGLLGTKKALFIGVQNGYQRHFRQIQAFAQQVDADQDVVDTQPEVAQ